MSTRRNIKMSRRDELYYRCFLCGTFGFAPNGAIADIWNTEGCEECSTKLAATARRLIESTVLILILDNVGVDKLSVFTSLGHQIYTLAPGGESAKDRIVSLEKLSVIKERHRYSNAILISEDLPTRLKAVREGLLGLTWSQFSRTVLEPFMTQFGDSNVQSQ